MAIQEASPPAAGLYRIGRWPDPLAWPLWEHVRGVNRFDDPLRRFRVLYTAELRLTCFLETLAPLRLSLEVVAALAQLPAGDRQDDPATKGIIPADWRFTRVIGHLIVDSGQRWPDLRAMETREALREQLATTLVALGYRDFDAGIALLQDRQLTQAIAQWAYDQGYQGIVYPSRFDTSLTCWAVFENARFTAIGETAIARDDPDFVEAAGRFDLTIAE